MFKNQAHYELSKLYYEVGDYENAVNVSDEMKIMTHQTSEIIMQNIFFTPGLANYKLKNYRLAKSTLIFFLIYMNQLQKILNIKKWHVMQFQI